MPLPTTCVGCDVSTGLPSAGTAAWPLGLPACGRLPAATGGGFFFVVVVGFTVVFGGAKVAGAPIAVWVGGAADNDGGVSATG